MNMRFSPLVCVRIGQKQKEQKAVVEDFKNGVHNILVATCIGEEGLDIGYTDLIICYDTIASPIRTVQRMGLCSCPSSGHCAPRDGFSLTLGVLLCAGRTGRAREGQVVFLMTEGMEENNYEKTKNKQKFMYKVCASECV